MSTVDIWVSAGAGAVVPVMKTMHLTPFGTYEGIMNFNYTDFTAQVPPASAWNTPSNCEDQVDDGPCNVATRFISSPATLVNMMHRSQIHAKTH